MLIGIRSSITLDRRPTDREVHELRQDSAVTYDVIELDDGRVVLQYFRKLDNDEIDSVETLHLHRDVQRRRLEAIRQLTAANAPAVS